MKQRFREFFYHRLGSGREPRLFPPTPKLTLANQRIRPLAAEPLNPLPDLGINEKPESSRPGPRR